MSLQRDNKPKTVPSAKPHVAPTPRKTVRLACSSFQKLHRGYRFSARLLLLVRKPALKAVAPAPLRKLFALPLENPELLMGIRHAQHLHNSSSSASAKSVIAPCQKWNGDRDRRERAIRTIQSGVCEMTWCPHWDSNPDCDDFKSSASAGWAMGACLARLPM